MIPLEIHLNGDNCWPDLQEREHSAGVLVGLALLQAGTVKGAPTVTLRIHTDDGQVVLAQTTARLLLTAAGMVAAKCPDLAR